MVPQKGVSTERRISTQRRMPGNSDKSSMNDEEEEIKADYCVFGLNSSVVAVWVLEQSP